MTVPIENFNFQVGVTNCDTQFIVVDSYHELDTTMTTRFCGEYLNIIDADTKSSIIIGKVIR